MACVAIREACAAVIQPVHALAVSREPAGSAGRCACNANSFMNERSRCRPVELRVSAEWLS